MFRVLIVEDVKATLEDVVKLLKEVFPAAEIDEATNVEAAVERLEKKRHEGLTYDAAILDFKLPQRVGALPGVDTGLCDKIKTRMPNLPVWHVTAFPDDTMVAEHMRRSHNSPDDRPFILISKSESGWSEKLVEGLERHFYSGLVNQRLDDVFGPEGIFSRKSERRQRRDGHLTHDLRAAAAEIEELWDKPLTDRVRERVKVHFEVPSAGKRLTLKPPRGRVL